MINGDTEIGLHEERDLYATFAAASGTITLASCKVSLYDSGGGLAGSPAVDSVDATGITSGASAAPQAWYLFKPTTLVLARGPYRLVFQSVDSNGLKRKVTIWVNVLFDYE